MERRNVGAFRNSIFRETHLETVVFSGSHVKHYFLELLLLVVALAEGFGDVGSGGGVLGIPCT